jgi:hypothetical protein
MPIDDLQTAIREATDIDWSEEEAWRRASEWTCTPQLVFALLALIRQEGKDNETDTRAR